jgi:hypothetical protein
MVPSSKSPTVASVDAYLRALPPADAARVRLRLGEGLRAGRRIERAVADAIAEHEAGVLVRLYRAG